MRLSNDGVCIKLLTLIVYGPLIDDARSGPLISLRLRICRSSSLANGVAQPIYLLARHF
jgi:hypothetical protein